MSEELKQTVAPEAEIQEEKETLNTETQTDEGNGPDKAKEDVEKEEENPYQKQLDELNKAVEKKDEIIEHKNRALEAEKSKRKEIEKKLETAAPSESDELKKQIENLTKSIEAINSSKLDEKIARLTDDPVKQEVIKKHYQQSIVKTGNEELDIRRALAIADENIVYQYHENKAREEGNDLFLSGLPKSSVRGKQAGVTADPVAREAAELLKSWGQDKAADRLIKS